MTSKKLFEFLEDFWGNCNIKKGEMLLLHSNLFRLIYQCKKIDKKADIPDIFESLISALGSDGTLIFPTFNFQFIKEKKFDYIDSKSEMGPLSEFARTKIKSIRTKHPVYSFCVYGKNKSLFSNIDNISAFSKHSPFDLLKKYNGKIGILDLDDQRSMTYYHYIEELNEVHYRFHKKFSGIYVGPDRIQEKKTYEIFVRNLNKNIITNVNPAGEYLWEKKIYKGSRPGTGTGFRIASSVEIYDCISEIIQKKQEEKYLYKIK